MNWFTRFWNSLFGYPSTQTSTPVVKPNPPREVVEATTPKKKTSLDLRRELVGIARLDRGKTEVTKNQAPWIKKYWPATSYPEGKWS